MNGDKKMTTKTETCFQRTADRERWPSLLAGSQGGSGQTASAHTETYWGLELGGAGYRITGGSYGCKAVFNGIPVHCVGATVFP